MTSSIFPTTVLDAEALLIGLLVAELVQPGRGLHAAPRSLYGLGSPLRIIPQILKWVPSGKLTDITVEITVFNGNTHVISMAMFNSYVQLPHNCGK